MIVAELVTMFLELDQKSECLFTKRSDTPYIYLVATLPDGKRVAAEMPTGVEKEKHED
jgi:hypothetical protein